jgi:hypothetical protein
VRDALKPHQHLQQDEARDRYQAERERREQKER